MTRIFRRMDWIQNFQERPDGVLIDAFEQSMNPTGTAIDEQVAATSETSAAIRRGMVARRILEGVVENKYRSNFGKLSAWHSASHIERAPKKAKPLIV